jgi:predicted CoA-binding protein
MILAATKLPQTPFIWNKKTPLAVVGVSRDPAKYGHRIFTDLLHAHYTVFGVHPQGGVVAGQKLFPTLADLPVVPELVITVVPPASTEQIVQACIDRDVPAIWMQPGSESDPAIQRAQKAGLQVISQACFMHVHQLWPPS